MPLKKITKENIAIVIPIYKKTINEYEKISLMQCEKILQNYEKIFVAPDNLDIDYGDKYKNYKILRFRCTYFKNLKTYSELLLSWEFYQAFREYKYILIYQLDAFVFRDDLIDYCNRGWDYVGAPCSGGTWDELNITVGNGGFSLRNVNKCMRVVSDIDNILQDDKIKSAVSGAEDLFFSYCGIRRDIDFCVPDRREAEKFAVAHNEWNVYNRLKKTMGCHGWYRWNYDYWIPLVNNCGYNAEMPLDNIFTSAWMRQQKIRNYLLKRLLIYKRMSLKDAVNSVIGHKIVNLWGYGTEGRICYKILNLADIKVKIIYDINALSTKKENKIFYPDLEEIEKKDEYIVIATSNYEKDISLQLNERGVRFSKFSTIADSLIRQYYRLKPRM